MSVVAGTEAGRGLGAALVATAVIGLVLGVGAAAIGSLRSALGVGIGAAFGTANLWALTWVVRRLLATGGSRAGWGLLVALKFAALVGACALLLRAGVVDLAPLGIGYGALPLGLVVGPLAFGASVREEG